MPVYNFKAIAENGTRIQGEESAESEQALREDLARRGVMVQELRLKRSGLMLSYGKRIKPENFMLLNQEFTALLRAGLNIPEALKLAAPAPEAWWYYGGEHGQHIGFFRRRTLDTLAKQLGCHVHSDGHAFHLFTRRSIAPWRWSLARQTRKIAPLVARLRLKSKVWSDHAVARQLALEQARAFTPKTTP